MRLAHGALQRTGRFIYAGNPADNRPVRWPTLGIVESTTKTILNGARMIRPT